MSCHSNTHNERLFIQVNQLNLLLFITTITNGSKVTNGSNVTNGRLQMKNNMRRMTYIYLQVQLYIDFSVFEHIYLNCQFI